MVDHVLMVLITLNMQSKLQFLLHAAVLLMKKTTIRVFGVFFLKNLRILSVCVW